MRDEVARLTQDVVNALTGRRPEGSAIAIEDIQDQVELGLMRGGAATMLPFTLGIAAIIFLQQVPAAVDVTAPVGGNPLVKLGDPLLVAKTK